MTAAIYASDEPLRTIRLRRASPDDEADSDTMRAMVRASFELAEGWLVPLGISLLAECCGPDNFFQRVGRPASASRYLRRSNTNPKLRVTPEHAGAVTETIDAPIEVERTLLHIDALLAQRCSRGVTGLAEMCWNAVQVRVPFAPDPLHYPGGPVAAVVEQDGGHVWALGPAKASPVGPPACLRARNEHDTTDIEVELFWDLWTKHPAAMRIVDDAVAKLTERSAWELV